MILFEFQSDEIADAREIALSRQRTKADVTNRKIDRGRSDIATHWMGARGEVAAARHFGGRVDKTVRKYGDGHGGDIRLPDGRVIEAKTRQRQGWDFALTSNDPREFRADLGVLCYELTPESFWSMLIVGWVTRAEFLEQHRVEDYGYGPRCVLGPDAFHPAEDWDMAWATLAG